MPGCVLTMLTDFGRSDAYVAQMKGAVLSIDATVSIVDLSHEIAAQDIRQAALLLADSWRAFPAGTVHVVVVDPGVGSQRAIVAVEAAGHRFVAPDNGVLSAALADSNCERVFHVDQSRNWRMHIAAENLRDAAATFHGRDIMAPVAARWARGDDPSTFGEQSSAELVRIASPQPRVERDRVIGQLLRVDRFGNLISNLTGDHLRQLGEPRQLQVSVSGHSIDGIQAYYSQRSPGTLMALFDSGGRLEIAVNQGSARERTGAQIDSVIEVHRGA